MGMGKNKHYAKIMEQGIAVADMIRLAPVVFFVSAVFLFVGVHEYTLPLSQFSFMAETDDTIIYDCFSHIKMVAVIITACVSAILMSYYMLTGKRHIRKTRLYIPVAVYAALIILSYIMSDYKQFSLFGTYDRFEGTVVHLCYLLMMFYAINCVDGEKELKFIVDTLFAGVTVACLIGLTQLLGHDFFSGGLGKMIMLGGNSNDLEFNFGSGRVYQTVYNINYVAFYMCLVFPVVINRIMDMFLTPDGVRSREKARIGYTIWLCLLFVLMVINVAGADSSGSVPGIVTGSVCIFLLRIFKDRPKTVLCVIATGLTVMLVLAGYFLFKEDESERARISYIKTYGDTIEFMINDALLVAEYDRSTPEFMLKNAAGDYLDTFTLPDTPYRYDFEDATFNGIISFSAVEDNGITYSVFETGNEKWVFVYTDEGVRYLNPVGKGETLGETEHAGIIRNYPFGSGRGYIWDTTLPLIKHRILWGAGADTFMFVFPQDDYVTRYSHGLSKDCVYDKPHNMFLQIAVSFGLTGLMAFLCMIACVFAVMPSRIKAGQITFLTVSVCIGIASFLISALVNDSSVSVMPMFYGLIGCCAAAPYHQVQTKE